MSQNEHTFHLSMKCTLYRKDCMFNIYFSRRCLRMDTLGNRPLAKVSSTLTELQFLIDCCVYGFHHELHTIH